ncbi:GIY-YIG nuclease family protein [Aliagarivorans taiwanensis]|uniref:GIY-YIG nuclease family protein n=1 Tax=Aliagarivorans taiwanensis TaxID=561966 RepID=UPI001FDFD9B6|nr:GIY-YIG nuclease family protein [Aliagarivorans taiwanensis]
MTQDSVVRCSEENWSVYMIRTRHGHLYTGITNDVERRFHSHQHASQGAKFLKGKGPLLLVFQQKVGSKSQAARYEYRIKRLPKRCKESLVAGTAALDELVVLD